MNRIECPGLDGSNPLHFLASLGVLRLLPDGSRMGWKYLSQYTPWFEFDVPDFTAHISQGIRRNVPDHAETISAKKRDGSINKVKCDVNDRIAISQAYDFLEFSDIPRVLPNEFHKVAEKVMQPVTSSCLDAQHPAWILSSLNAENTPDKDGLLEPTAFSFSNGGGMQFLHKDFLSLASLVSPASISKMISGDENRFVWFTSLNWDPMALRPYANQWDDPESSPKLTDIAANALAFIGLGSLPVIPAKDGNLPLCYDPKQKMFQWPLWNHPGDLMLINSLLAVGTSLWEAKETVGVIAQFESERFSSNKRLYFSPSRSI